MLTEQEKAIGRAVLRELENNPSVRSDVLKTRIAFLERRMANLEQELAKVKAHANQLEQAVLGLGNRR